MTNINIKLTPKKIKIGSVATNLKVYDPANSEVSYQKYIYLTGVPEYGDDAFLKMMDGGSEIKLPKVFNVFISTENVVPEFNGEEKIQKNKHRCGVGKLYYLPQYEDEWRGKELCSLHSDIVVNEEQFDSYIELIQSRKAKLVSEISFRGASLDDAVKTDVTGHFVTWDVEKSQSINLESFYLSLHFMNEIKSLNRILSKKLSNIENELRELKIRKYLYFNV